MRGEEVVDGVTVGVDSRRVFGSSDEELNAVPPVGQGSAPHLMGGGARGKVTPPIDGASLGFGSVDRCGLRHSALTLTLVDYRGRGRAGE